MLRRKYGGNEVMVTATKVIIDTPVDDGGEVAEPTRQVQVIKRVFLLVGVSRDILNLIWCGG